MRDLTSKAERYRKEAVKCRERAKIASPAFLGDFYRNIAVRYLFMAEDASRRAEEEGRITVERTAKPNIECGSERERRVGQDFELFALWAGDTCAQENQNKGFLQPKYGAGDRR
jgi:hypothetical protein